MDFSYAESFENGIIVKDIRNFDMYQVFSCGQCFRWNREENGNYIGVAHGIPKNKQKYIFNRFYQLNKDDGYRGTGIGLSLVKSFTELMKGKIELNSDIGKGTEFVIYLPDVVDSSNEYLSYDNYYNDHVLIMNKEFSEL